MFPLAPLPLIQAFLAFILLILGLTTAANLLALPRLARSSGELPDLPLVSVLIPARNEAGVIGRAVRTLLAQEGVSFELHILDDRSTDGTAGAVRAAAAGDPRMRLLEGTPLPPGWLGKNWACHQLAEAARGELLLFADADVAWEPGGLAAILAHQSRSGAALLSVWPALETGTWAEWLVVPLIKFAIMTYLPIAAVHHLPWPGFAAANGQCLLFKRSTYERVGGHAAVRRSIIEDIALGRAVKRHGLPLRLVDAAGRVRCRMYDGWPAVRAGFGKNILAGHGDSVAFLLLSTLFHWFVFVGPWLLLLLRPGWIALLLVLGFTAVRAAGEWHVGRRPGQALGRALLMPLSVALMTGIAWQGLRWRFGGGPVWKGRRAGGGG